MNHFVLKIQLQKCSTSYLSKPAWNLVQKGLPRKSRANFFCSKSIFWFSKIFSEIPIRTPDRAKHPQITKPQSDGILSTGSKWILFSYNSVKSTLFSSHYSVLTPYMTGVITVVDGARFLYYFIISHSTNYFPVGLQLLCKMIIDLQVCIFSD